MKIPLSAGFTPVENVLPKITQLEQDKLVVSSEWVKQNHAKICGDMCWHDSC